MFPTNLSSAVHSIHQTSDFDFFGFHLEATQFDLIIVKAQLQKLN